MASSLDLRTFFLFAIECTFFLAFVENMKSNESRSEFPKQQTCMNAQNVCTVYNVQWTYILTALDRIYASRFKMPQVCFFNHNFVLYMRTLMSNFYGHSFYLKSNDTLAKSKSIWFNSYLRSFLKILVKRLQ